ncbi:hypothetical protein ACKKBG_A34625 [Auxenochlorella protothecoides x Auxenochlorella symbiontica]|uniref:Uncharacterized protein n=1 Tax=Auxenochlorella protothecoides TaxID=3075 RepID=A0A1D2AEN8_AUXPR
MPKSFPLNVKPWETLESELKAKVTSWAESDRAALLAALEARNAAEQDRAVARDELKTALLQTAEAKSQALAAEHALASIVLERDSLAHSLDASQQAQLYASKELEECQSSLKTHKEQLAVADAVNLARGSDLQAKQRELEKALQQLEALHARNTDLEEQLAGSQSAHRAAEQAARSAEARASGVAHQAASAAGEAAEREREWQAQLSVSEGRRRQAELGLDAAVKDLASFLEETDTLRGELETAKAAAAAAEKAQSELSRRMEEQQRVSAQAAAKQRQAATAEIASLASQLEVLRAECGAAIAKAAEQGSQVEWLESALKEAQIAAKDARAAWRSAEGALHSAVRSRTAAQGRRLALLEAWVHERGMRLHAQEDMGRAGEHGDGVYASSKDVALESQSLQQILDAVRELRQEGGWDSEVRLPGQDYCTPSPSPIKTPGRS